MNTRPVARLITVPARTSHSRSKKSWSFSGSIPRERGSASMNTGCAPAWTTALTVAMNVKVGTSTSSPGFTPAASSATWRAAVPLTVATA